jgi:hypothetical protein
MTADLLDLISVEASLADGRLDEETNARLLERRNEARARLDVTFALDLADRLGEDALREAIDKSVPPSVRASMDALIKVDGGALPLVKNRMGRIKAGVGPIITASDDAFGCGLGAAALVAGVVLNAVMGGIAAVGGIVLMASTCAPQ